MEVCHLFLRNNYLSVNMYLLLNNIKNGSIAPIPDDNKLNSPILKIIIDNKETYTRQIQKLSELKDLLLSKLATAES
jgi:hypothetical protein